MQGIEVFRPDGSVKFSTLDRLGRILGTYQVGASSSSGSFVVPGIETGEPFLIVSVAKQSNTPLVAAPCYAVVDRQSRTVSWSRSNGQLASTIVVGVY